MSKPRHHSTSPWLLDIRDAGLLKHHGAGHSHRLDITAEPPEQTVSGVLEVPADSMVVLKGRVDSVAEGVLVSATASATAHGTCSRCLTDISVPIEADFRELYAYPDSLTAETTDEDEIARIKDETVDLAPVVHDELVLTMPTIPLCREDCPGLCPECGQRLDSVGPDHGHEILDPRWAGLAELLETTSDVSRDRDSASGPTSYVDPKPIDPALKEN